MKKIYLFLLHFTILTSNLAFAEIVPENYKWGSVSVGGGGYILGVYVHPQNPDLFYIRTDVGGAYRWDTLAQRMIPLNEWVSYEQSNLYGVYGIALNPTDENLIYMSLGKYTHLDSDVYKSTDQGETWEALNFNAARFGANHSPNRKGNPLVLNHHKPEELWVGTVGEGLHKFSEGVWEKIETIPGDGVVRSIAVDKADGKYIYVAVTYQVRWGLIGNKETTGIYRSTDGGNTFSIVPGFDRTYDQFSDISLSKDSDQLFVSSLVHDDKPGAVFRLDNPRTDSTWVNITPESGTFRTVTASPHDNNTVMTARGTFNSLNRFAVSTDSGENWTFKNNYTVNNIVPWHPSSYPGSAISQIEFDPVNPNKVYFTDWYTIYSTTDWTQDQVHWSNEISRGHEEIVPAKLVAAHPENEAGAILYVGGADISGISQLELENYSTIPNWRTLAGSVRLQEVSGIDYSESSPNTVVTMGGQGWGMTQGGVFISKDGGQTFSSTTYSGGGGKIAISSLNKNNFVTVDNTSTVRYTNDGGESFQSSAGAGTGYRVGDIFSIVDPLASDRVNGKFYLYKRGNGQFLVSTDGGESFNMVGIVGASNSNFVNVKTVPGIADHIWITKGNGLHFSTDGGYNWTKHQDFAVANLLAIGKAQTPESYPAIYVWGRKTTDNQLFFYRSTDAGESFQQVNVTTKAGNNPGCMTADLAVFGRFYVGTNGRGVYYAEIDEGTVEAPAAPDGLTIEIQNYNARLHWTDNSTNASGFRIERKVNESGQWKVLSSYVPVNQTSYNDTWLDSLTTYYYRVRAYNYGGDSQWSNEVSVTSGEMVFEGEIYIQAEDAKWDRTAVERAEYSGFNGEGYVEYGSKGSWILFDLFSPRAGESKLTLRYANGDLIDRPCDLYVNGVKVTSVPFPTSGGWSEWVTWEYTINLIQGHNTLLLIANNDDGGPNLDEVSYVVPDISSSTESLVLKYFSVYPNPVENMVNIHFNGGGYKGVNLKVFDIKGRQMTASPMSFVTKTQLSMDSYPPGLYFLKLQKGDQIFYHKVIKK